MTMPVLAIQQNNNGTALQEFFRTVQLDAENKVPAEALRIVGALSQGYIIESGDNANGYYVRFADGTQVCWSTYSRQVGSASTEVIITCVFPAEFVTIPIGIAHSGRWEVNASYFYETTATGCSLRGAISSGSGSFTVSMVYVAIGRWK